MAGLGWLLPAELDDERLERLLYPSAGRGDGTATVAGLGDGSPRTATAQRDAGAVVGGVSHWPGAQAGFGYSWFCDLYREWVGRLKPTLRHVHTAGERVFIDFAGHTMEVIDGATGEVRRAEVFVAVLGASSYTYAEAVWSQSLPNWIAVHVAVLTRWRPATNRQLPRMLAALERTRLLIMYDWCPEPLTAERRREVVSSAHRVVDASTS